MNWVYDSSMGKKNLDYYFSFVVVQNGLLTSIFVTISLFIKQGRTQYKFLFLAENSILYLNRGF